MRMRPDHSPVASASTHPAAERPTGGSQSIGAGLVRARVVLDTASVRALHGSQHRLESCFTDAEIALLPHRVDPVPTLAARLAAKVATAGLLAGSADTGLESPVDRRSVVEFSMPSQDRAAVLRNIEVLASPNGVPKLVLDPVAHPGVRSALVSLSHDAGLAAALVVLGSSSRSRDVLC